MANILHVNMFYIKWHLLGSTVGTTKSKTFIVSRCLADCSVTILHTQVVTHGSETIIQQEFVVFVVLAVATALSFPLFAHNTHTHAFCSQ